MTTGVMQAQTSPEVCRSPLDSLCVRLKALDFGARTIPQSLQLLPTPPAPASVEQALRVLFGLGILVPKAGGEELTPLGGLLARLPVEPRVGKLILGGAAFGRHRGHGRGGLCSARIRLGARARR